MISSSTIGKRLLLGLGLLACGASVAAAQGRSPAEIASDTGPDRLARLAAAAKKEGVVTLYTSRVAEDTAPLGEDFTKRYGVAVQLWRASNQDIIQRAVAESRAGRCPADVISSGTPALEPLYREQLLQPVKSPTTAELMPQALRPHGAWVGVSVNIIASAYNADLVKPQDVPKSYDDLKDPKWKSRLTIEAQDADWFAALADKLGEEKTTALFREIVRVNGISTRIGHTLIANMVAEGEVPLALTTYSYKPEQLTRLGAPIRTLYLPPLIALATGVSVTRCAPHPNAAVLFYEYMLREGQQVLAKRDIVPTNLSVKPLPPNMEINFMDPVQMLDHGEKWTALWNDIFIKPH
ncbi:MAG TPA: extracellular solute-binding protein [Xanthobacteraceae bacterium]|nr:extracellular solute-binding protein [Xanthobacteraceae bacterium]